VEVVIHSCMVLVVAYGKHIHLAFHKLPVEPFVEALVVLGEVDLVVACILEEFDDHFSYEEMDRDFHYKVIDDHFAVKVLNESVDLEMKYLSLQKMKMEEERKMALLENVVVELALQVVDVPLIQQLMMVPFLLINTSNFYEVTPDILKLHVFFLFVEIH
jgi:hypothetical protein